MAYPTEKAEPPAHPDGHIHGQKALDSAYKGAEADLSNHDLDMSDSEMRKIRRRIDLRIVPYFSLLYLLSFLDRVNIGQARTAGLERDLGLSSYEYQICLTVFFVSYVAVEVPSNILLGYLKPHRWIFIIAVSWSIVATLMGIVENYGGLVATRFMLGLIEGGLFPGLNFLLSTWYSRGDLGIRVGIFFAGATLSGAFGGILAFGIRHMAGVGGRGGWAWIFILEGLITLVCALPAWWIVPDFPTDERSKKMFKSPGDMSKWLHRLNLSQGMTSANVAFSWDQIWKAVLDWKVYVYATLYISTAVPFYSLALFTPSIITGLGYTNANANLLSIPPYVLGFITTIASTLVSDRMHLRGPFIIFWMIIVIVGYAILISDVAIGVKYFAVHLTVGAISPCIALDITWVSMQFGPIYTRATAMGIFFSAGNSAGIISSWIYPRAEAPRYIKGHAISLAFAGLAIVCSCVLMVAHHMENKKKDALVGKVGRDAVNPIKAGEPEEKQRWGLQGMATQDILKLGGEHPGFRRML